MSTVALCKSHIPVNTPLHVCIPLYKAKLDQNTSKTYGKLTVEYNNRELGGIVVPSDACIPLRSIKNTKNYGF